MLLFGHQHIWHFLKQSAQSGKISHAYLFSGPEKVGKKTVALEFIKFLNCEDKNIKNRPCQECRVCREITRKNYPDLFFISPLKKEIQIDQIKNLNWQLSLQRYESFFKTAIIDEAHLMNKEAQNCLLKTLEEPKGQTIIFLISSFPELILPTIASRTKKIKFSRVGKKETEKFLKGEKLSEEKIKKMISIAWGRPGEIIDFLSDPEKLKEREKRLEELEKLIGSPLNLRFEYAKKITQNPEELKEILSIWLEYFREKFLSLVENSEDEKLFLKLKKVINLIQDINFLISKTEVNKTLAIENLLMEI